MPTYQYACTECAHAFEQVQSFSDDALTECPQCQGRLRKLFNAVGVVFKGSGFYRNDSRTTSDSSSGESSSKDSTSGDSSTKSETTEKKAEPKAEKKSETSTKSPQTAAS